MYVGTRYTDNLFLPCWKMFVFLSSDSSSLQYCIIVSSPPVSVIQCCTCSIVDFLMPLGRINANGTE